jgi:hypothetical protein
MTHEQQTAIAPAETDTAWQVFQYWTGSTDVDRFRTTYLGRYADREAFGSELLARLGADARLQRLPDWLQAYIRFDGAAVVADFERAGISTFSTPRTMAAATSSTAGPDRPLTILRCRPATKAGQ